MSQPLDKSLAVEYGQFVIDAYSMYDADNTNLTPVPITPRGWELVAWIQMSDFVLGNKQPKFYGYIARSGASPDAHVIAIRGTEGWVEWYDDFSIFKVPFAQVPNAGRVSHGFDTIYSTLKVVPHPQAVFGAKGLTIAPDGRSLQGSFGEQVAQIIDARPRSLTPGVIAPAPSVIVTGHSLGAALCTLYAIEHVAKKQSGLPMVCTFASPRVGDANFVKAFNVFGLTSWRIVNAPDIVPNTPPDILGYAHVDVESLFDSKNLVRWSPSCWHAMTTYLALLDNKLMPDPGCALGTKEIDLLAQQ